MNHALICWLCGSRPKTPGLLKEEDGEACDFCSTVVSKGVGIVVTVPDLKQDEKTS